jgi:hypothetical protein
VTDKLAACYSCCISAMMMLYIDVYYFCRTNFGKDVLLVRGHLTVVEKKVEKCQMDFWGNGHLAVKKVEKGGRVEKGGKKGDGVRV